VREGLLSVKLALVPTEFPFFRSRKLEKNLPNKKGKK